jgi:transposase
VNGPRVYNALLLALTVYLYRDPVDFRKSYRGLSLIVEQELGHDPFNGALYVFRNRNRSRIKCLFWEHTGWVLYYKALSEERFHWPKPDETIMMITGEQLNWLLDGYNLSLMTPHRRLSYEAVG